MSPYNWFLIFNQTTFNALNLYSKTYTVNLEGIGEKEILVTKGETVAITYEGTMLPINLNSVNPFEFDDLAVYINSDNDVYLGVLIED
jgi:hypothetical protein